MNNRLAYPERMFSNFSAFLNRHNGLSLLKRLPRDAPTVRTLNACLGDENNQWFDIYY
jgi:hypothetical protein